MMNIKRRDFLQLVAFSTGSLGLNGWSYRHNENEFQIPRLNTLKNNLSAVLPINLAERKSRIEKAQKLMMENKIEAIILDSGTSLIYFTGITWWPSERTMVALIPANGEVKYICPGFEEARLRELIKIGNEVKAWQEDESPYRLIARTFGEMGIHSGNIGIEERVRFFIVDGVRKEAPNLKFISADPVTIPCRLIKSSAEIALMKNATDITMAAMKLGIASLKVGMAPSEFSQIVNEAHIKMGAEPDFALCNFAEASAFPHGSVKPQKLKKGDIVLMDCGGRVEGYSSDMTRTIVFGAEPNSRQLEIWNLEKKAQSAGFNAAKLGAPCENVDNAARKVIVDAGFGPDYKLPGLPHRTGHGIGMDGHEWGNMVRGNQLPIQVGMCFSIEPNISIPGEFGVRLEDCVYMTENGPRWFSEPSPSIHQPFV